MKIKRYVEGLIAQSNQNEMTDERAIDEAEASHICSIALSSDIKWMASHVLSFKHLQMHVLQIVDFINHEAAHHNAKAHTEDNSLDKLVALIKNEEDRKKTSDELKMLCDTLSPAHEHYKKYSDLSADILVAHRVYQD